jgi:predicted Kef-type K+ transport protein
MHTSLIISITFIAGLSAHLIRLPPLLGFLLAGFVLHGLGVAQTPIITTLSDLGVTLLLFTVGLKLNIRTLLRTEVWGSAITHLGASFGLYIGVLSLLKWTGLAAAASLGQNGILIAAFALCFSSTVYAVKTLEEKSEMQSLYGRVAVGILIMQDLFAVVFLSASTGQLPSPWALSLLLLIPLRPWLFKLLERVGHGELQLICGFFLAFVLGADLFSLVGIKPDLGALMVGMLLAGHRGANGLAKSLFAFKEIFLVAFFLSVGMSHMPNWETLGIALLLTGALVVKTLLYLAVMLLFRLRSRTAFLGALSLGNYSEFGLIVTALAVQRGWLDGQWMVILALSLSLSFLLTAPLHQQADQIYQHLRPRLKRLQRKRLHIDDQPINLGQKEVVILGMGRIGTGAYDQLIHDFPYGIIGIDTDLDKVQKHTEQNRAVIQGDATDSDFWERLVLSQQIKLVLLAMPQHRGNEYALEQLKRRQFNVKIAAITQYQDDYESLKRLGADKVYNLYNEAGSGFAKHVMHNQLIDVQEHSDIEPTK